MQLDQDKPLMAICRDLEICQRALDDEPGLFEWFRLRRELGALRREFSEATEAAMDLRVQQQVLHH